jgi:hypothetical protein
MLKYFGFPELLCQAYRRFFGAVSFGEIALSFMYRLEQLLQSGSLPGCPYSGGIDVYIGRLPDNRLDFIVG